MLKHLNNSPIDELFKHAIESVRGENISIASLCGGLISIDNLNRIKTLIDKIKSVPGKRYGFECVLESNDLKGDFSFSITRDNAEKAINNGVEISKWAPDLADNSTWEMILGFFEIWLNKKSVLYHCVDSIFLELDTSKNNAAAEVPGIFISLMNKTDNQNWYSAIAFSALTALSCNISIERKKLIEKCFESFASLTLFIHFGIMFSRESCPIKLVAMGVSLQNAREALKNMGCRTLESIDDEVWNYILKCSSPYASTAISIDITDKIEERVCIEISLPQDQSTENKKHQWNELLEWIVKQGWCVLDKKQAVLNWIGTYSCRASSGIYEDNLVINRDISHIKFEAFPGNNIKSKIYLEYYQEDSIR